MVAKKNLWAEIDQMDEIIIFQKESEKINVWNTRIEKFVTELKGLVDKYPMEVE